MDILNYEPEFEDLISKLKGMPNGERLLDLSGISCKTVDINRYTKNFFKSRESNVADLSVDSNSNIKQRSAITYLNEASKGLFKLNNYHMMWKALKRKFGIERANEAVKADITGDIYIADQHLWTIPYCYAFSAMDILNMGMPFIVSPISKPAVHFDAFIQHIIQSTMYFSNSIAGAVAFPDLFPALWFVYQNDKKIGYPTDDPVKFDEWVNQQFQLFVYTINQPYRSGTQSPFVNISVFDRYFMEDMFAGMTWVNPKTDEIVDIDLDGVDKLQRQFSEWFTQESLKQLFTFPVMTSCSMASVSDDGKRTILDEEFFRWTAKLNRERALFNIYVGEAGRLSTCEFFDEKITVFENFDNSTDSCMTMQEMWDKYAGKPDSKGFAVPKKNIYVWGVNPETREVSKMKVKRLLRQGFYKILKITFANGESIKVDRFHQFVLFSDFSTTLQAASLKVGDEIPFWKNGEIVPSEIVSIEDYTEDKGDGFVYDVELEEHHLFINSSGIITHNCCRLRSDAAKMKEFFNSLGSGGVKIGSHRVCTINLPRVAHNSKDLNDFVEKLLYKMELARDILKEHRDLLQYEIDQGLLPLYTLGFMELKTQFSTVGIIGFYEAMEILGYDMVKEENLPIAKRVINAMNEKNDQFSDEDQVLYNLEQIPGESAAIKLAQKDNLVYGDSMNYQMYSNQFIPLVKPVPMATRIKAQGVFDASMSGGSILHLNIAEKINSVEMLLTLMNYAVENNVVYFAPNYNMAICEDNHVNVGKMETCQKCGKPIVRNMLRVVGFYTDVSNWKKERRGKIDYESRVFY